MTKATEVFHIFTSSYPNLLIKWRSTTSSFPLFFSIMRRHVNFWGGVKIASVHSILWITVFEYHLKYLIFGANSNRTFLVILKDCSTLGKTRNMTERDVFVWLGIVYFTYYFWPKSICALCYNRRRIMSKCGNVPYINK